MTPHCWDKSKFVNLARGIDRDLSALKAFDSFIIETLRKHGGIGSLYSFDGDLWNANNNVTIAIIAWDDFRELDLIGDHSITRVMESYIVAFIERDIDIPEVTDQFPQQVVV